jgi:hypothetical protein
VTTPENTEGITSLEVEGYLNERNQAWRSGDFTGLARGDAVSVVTKQVMTRAGYDRRPSQAFRRTSGKLGRVKERWLRKMNSLSC